MERSHFTRLVGVSCLGAVVPLSMGGCASVHYFSSSVKDNILKVPISEFEGTSKGQTFVRKFIVVESASLDFPIALYKASGEYDALWTECTHQNCEVKPYDGIMTCPCHGSEFDISGTVLEGPAELPLKSFQVSTDESFIYVHLS